VDAPAFRRGNVTDRPARTVVVDAVQTSAIEAGAPASRELAARLTEALRVIARTAAAQEQSLGQLDAIAGDGDHGQGMVLGSSAALRAAEEALAADAGARTLLVRAGDAWSEGAGGTSGALWGSALTAVGGALSDTQGAEPGQIVAAVRQGGDAIVRLGGAEVGDKTMVDALVPFLESLAASHESGSDLRESWVRAAGVATDAAAATASITARRGRARTHGEHSLGHPDPGATSFALLMTAIAEKLGEEENSTPYTGARS
jgi:dihydroxyacetone kinase